MTEAVERLVNLALYLAAAREPVTAEQVRADVFGYPADQDDAAFIRMFERDKVELKRMGFVVDGDSEGLYRLNAAATYAKEVDLTPTEAAAVRVASVSLLDDPSFPFTEDLRLALAKVVAEVETGDVPAGARLADENPERQGALVSALSGAAAAFKRVTFGYTNSLGISAPHEVEPYGLFLHDGRWYLVGRDTAKDEIRTYTVARMESVVVNPGRPAHPDFERPGGFDVAGYIRLPFQYGDPAAEFEAVMRIEPAAAWRARALASGQGVLTEDADGGFTWRVGARSAARLLRFAIENGPGVSVTGPPQLTERLRTGLAEAVRLHG